MSTLMRIRALPTRRGPSDGFLKVQHPHENAISRLLPLLLLLLCIPTTLCLDLGLLPASGFLCDRSFLVLIKLNTTQSPVLMFDVYVSANGGYVETEVQFSI